MAAPCYAILRVTVLDGAGLPNESVDGKPYVVTNFEAQSLKTKHAADSTDPVWNESFMFDLTAPNAALRFSVCRGDQAEFVGAATAAFPTLEGACEKTLELDSKTGTIRVGLQITPQAAAVTVDSFVILHSGLRRNGHNEKIVRVRKRDTGRTYDMAIVSREALVYVRKELLRPGLLDHPCVIGTKFVLETESKCYLVRDRVTDSNDLLHHLQHQRSGPTPERARFFAAEMVLAIEYLHSRGMLHRDLKPEAFLVSEDGHLYLHDFGYEKVDYGGSVTTIEYLAPELIKGEPVGEAADWWSLGNVLYEMLCGLPPFYSEQMHQMYRNVLLGDLRFPDDLPEDAKTFIRRLLDRDPTTRLGAGTGRDVRWRPLLVDHSRCRPAVRQEICSALGLVAGDASREAPRHSACELLRLPFELLCCVFEFVAAPVDGADEVKSHPYFQGMDWERLHRKEIAPPWRPPPIRDDMYGFDAEFTAEPLYDGLAYNDDDFTFTFQGFTYTE